MKKHLNALLVLPLLLLPGCLTSLEPFYTEGDIISDDSIISTNQPENSNIYVYIEKGDVYQTNRYRVFLVEDPPCQMRFSGVLFQIGTNRFMNLTPVPEACNHIGGTVPSAIEILQVMTLRPLHLVVKLEKRPEGIRWIMMDHKGLEAAIKTAPEYFGKDGRMLPDTQRQREFLRRFGSDTNIFSQELAFGTKIE